MSRTPQSRRWVIVLAGRRALEGRGAEAVAGKAGDEVQDPVETAWDRAECLTDAERILTIASPGVATDERRAPGPVLAQPVDLGDTAAMLLGLAYVRAADPAATILLLPAAQRMDPEAAYVSHLGGAIELAESLDDRIVLLGAVADRVDGPDRWIEPAASFGGGSSPAVPVRTFHPASAAGAVQHYFDGCLWDTGVVAAPADVLWQACVQSLPEPTARFDALATVLHAVRLFRAPEAHRDVALRHVYGQFDLWGLGDSMPYVAAERAVVMPLEGVRWHGGTSTESMERRPPAGELELLARVAS